MTAQLSVACGHVEHTTGFTGRPLGRCQEFEPWEPCVAAVEWEQYQGGGYRVPEAVWSAPSGVKVDPYDPAFTSDMSPVGEPDKPAIYLFSNARDGDGVAYAMAEDGTVLGSHFCSHWGYMRHDLHDRADRKTRCEEHYPDGYRLVILGPSELPPDEVLERNRQQAEAARAADEGASDGT